MSPARPLLVLLLLVAAAPVVARAQPGATPPLPTDAPGDKSPAVALGLSLLGTGAGVAAILAASHVDNGEYVGAAGFATLLVGPSLGHFYAGEAGRGIRHAAVRLGALAVMGTGLLVVLSSPCAFGSENECPETREEVGVGIFFAGAALGVASTVYSIVDAPRAAGRTNRSRARATLLPMPVIGPDRSAGLGLGFTGSF